MFLRISLQLSRDLSTGQSFKGTEGQRGPKGAEGGVAVGPGAEHDTATADIQPGSAEREQGRGNGKENLTEREICRVRQRCRVRQLERDRTRDEERDKQIYRKKKREKPLDVIEMLLEIYSEREREKYRDRE